MPTFCTSHYMWPERRACESFCGDDIFYSWYYSNAQKASYEEGYYYNGDTVCGPCLKCRENFCNHWEDIE